MRISKTFSEDFGEVFKECSNWSQEVKVVYVQDHDLSEQKEMHILTSQKVIFTYQNYSWTSKNAQSPKYLPFLSFSDPSYFL